MTIKKVAGGIVSTALFCCISLIGSISVANADAIADGLPGNIGPPLVAMKARFPNKADLRAQIWDSTAANPNTIMPPFGKNRILTEKEVDLVTEFVYSL
jgi:sulfur oxidation c-type cytochrome SoxX